MYNRQEVVQLGEVLREVGQVIELSGSLAKVTVKRRSSCESCGACGIGARSEMNFMLKNEIGAQVGDRVLIEMGSNSLFKAAFLVYTIPLIGLLIGFILGQYIAGSQGMGQKQAELIGIGTGFFFLSGTFLMIRWLDRYQRLSSKLQPQLIAVVGAEEDSC